MQLKTAAQLDHPDEEVTMPGKHSTPTQCALACMLAAAAAVCYIGRAAVAQTATYTSCTLPRRS
jgi:hypothetical protein